MTTNDDTKNKYLVMTTDNGGDYGHVALVVDTHRVTDEDMERMEDAGDKANFWLLQADEDLPTEGDRIFCTAWNRVTDVWALVG